MDGVYLWSYQLTATCIILFVKWYNINEMTRVVVGIDPDNVYNINDNWEP